ncbi:PP2C family protein-serine/threonine phosphatase [Mycolicibacterium hodleri]|uniref:GAF domain-containing protein n=1 Tax=Mycolicibacterium hodleri TaxID=49897 RepID=A0A502EHJ1_9MYCO|nr:SpoIIE family protein phosphatase [Mycolicibacterium hodleri]TPG37155.1 GAF domain-containing protein [Mycolicibacterium hodleri]
MSTKSFIQHTLPPQVEEDRLRSVEQLYLLDTPPEERFAQITRMARSAFDLPMAAISLLDRDRQWFKQMDGLGVQNSVPRPQTVCAATILRAYEHPEDPGLIIEDTRESAFNELPGICADSGIRFYAGYPLYGPGGHAVGTFCVYDTKPRQLSSSQRRTFVELAAWAQRELQSTDDLERAATVQRQLLPPTLGDLPGYSVCAMCLPAYAVGGDFYDHYPVQGGMIFTVADVMGKGLGAAILTAVVRSALRGASRAMEWVGSDNDLTGAVSAASLQLIDDLSSTDSFVTLFHLKLATEDGSMQYVDAGHGFAALVRRDGTVQQLNGDGLPLGVLAEDSWTAHDASLQPGDTLVIASDGILDLVGEVDDLPEALKFIGQHPDPADLCAQARALAASKTTLDDVTIVAVRRELPP